MRIVKDSYKKGSRVGREEKMISENKKMPTSPIKQDQGEGG